MMSKSVHYPEGSVLLRNLQRDYPVISHGEGIYLYDQAGKRYLDGSSGALVVSVGHGNAAIAQAVAQQLSQCAYVNGMHFTSSVTESLAAALIAQATPALRAGGRAFFLNSGSEAIEAAIKFVRQLHVERGEPQRAKIIVRTPGYHGNTLYALSASARPHYQKFFGPLLSQVVMIDAPYPYRSAVADYAGQGADYYVGLLEEAILKEGPQSIAAFMCEPVIGSSAGASVPPPGYFEKVMALCARYGIITIADEVLCGAGRTGTFLASEQLGYDPDIVVLGKGISAGYVPLSAVLVRGEHVEEMRKGSGGFMHAQTFLQAPAAAAAGLATVQWMEEHQLLAHVQSVAPYFQSRLKEALLPLPSVGHVGGIGLLAGVELVADKATKRPYPRSEKVIEALMNHCFNQGLILWPNVGQANGKDGDLAMIGPPLIITKPQIDELIDLLASCLTKP